MNEQELGIERAGVALTGTTVFDRQQEIANAIGDQDPTALLTELKEMLTNLESTIDTMNTTLTAISSTIAGITVINTILTGTIVPKLDTIIRKCNSKNSISI